MNDLELAAIMTFAVVGYVHTWRFLILWFKNARCRCCTNGDSCDCERHCPIHRDPLPIARTHKEHPR